MIDPRRGYGYVATWNAHSSWLRWPLDHVFHEGGFATVSVERLDAFGSDHFPYLVRLCRQAGEGARTPPQRDAEDVAAANAVLAAGGGDRTAAAAMSLRPTNPSQPACGAGRETPVISIFDLAALLLTLSALFGWLNRRFLRMPHTIGLLVMGLLASLALVGLDLAFPGQHLYEDLTQVLDQVDFTDVVMNGMLAFLLFAGAMSLDLRMLRDRAWAVATLALVGTLISTALVGGAFWLARRPLGRPVPLAWALVFGALISPTDPVAVLATLKNVKVPEALEVEMQGEALFNDGIGIVLFTVLVAFAAGSGGEATSAGGVAKLLAAGGRRRPRPRRGHRLRRLPGDARHRRLPGRGADHPGAGRRHLRARPEAPLQRPAGGGRGRPARRRPRSARRDERATPRATSRRSGR